MSNTNIDGVGQLGNLIYSSADVHCYQCEEYITKPSNIGARVLKFGLSDGRGDGKYSVIIFVEISKILWLHWVQDSIELNHLL